MAFQQAAEVTVNGVMESSVVDGLLDVANKTALGPVLSVVKDLVEAGRACAKARREVMELIEFCVGILRCVVTVGGTSSLPEHIRQTLSHLQTEIEEIHRFVLQFKTPTCICWDLARKSRDRSTIAAHRQKLRRYLDTLAKSLAVAAAVPRRLRRTQRGARIPRGVPELPISYVKRPVDDSVVEDLVHPHGRSSCARCFCLWGMGGGGKSLLASSVVRNKRTLACFGRGVFWVQVGTSGREKNAMLLEQLALEFSRIPSPDGPSCPEVFDDTEDIIQYLQDARGDGRCLAVLDDVWHEDVVEAFLRTGLDLLVTTRTRNVVPSCALASFAEVGSMTDNEALQLLAKTSQAAGPLPEVEATLVVRKCGKLPLAVSMAGNLGRDDPQEPQCWRSMLDKLQDKERMWRQMERTGDGGTLFPVIDASFDMLPSLQKEQFKLMVVMAPRVPIPPDMLANLWDTTIRDAQEDAMVLVNCCLLQQSRDAYGLHELVLDYLRLSTEMSHGSISLATSRQARFLVKPEVLQEWTFGGGLNGCSVFSLVRLWVRIRELDAANLVKEYFSERVAASSDMSYRQQAGYLMRLLGEYENAEKVYRRALSIAEKDGPSSEMLSLTLERLGRVLKAQGKYSESESLHRRAMAITEARVGKEHPDFGRRLTSLAKLLHKRGKYDEAEPLYRQSMAITESTMGTEHPSFGRRLCNLAGLLESQGKYDEAKLLCCRALDITKRTMGPEHPSYGRKLNQFMILLERQGKYDEAEQVCRQVLAITEGALGTDHPDFGQTLNCLGILLEKQAKHKDAETLYRRVMTIIEKSLGSEHTAYGRSLSNLAGSLEKQEEFDEAERLYRRALDITEKTIGPDHPSYGRKLGNLAILLEKLGKGDEAEPLYDRALAIMERNFGTDHPEYGRSLNNLANSLKKQGKCKEAEPLYRRALVITEKSFGEKHPDFGQGLNNIANVLKKQGKFDEAETLYRRSMTITGETLGTGHPYYGQIINNLALLLEKQGKNGEADLLSRRALDIMERTIDKEHPSYRRRLSSLAESLDKRGKYEEAEPLFRSALAITERTVGTEHPTYHRRLSSLADSLEKQGKYEEAEPLFRAALDITERTVGTDHPTYRRRLSSLADSLEKQGKIEEAKPRHRRASTMSGRTPS